jgi:Fe-S cluster assembly protein SufD
MTQLAERLETYAVAFDELRRAPAFDAGGVRHTREAAFDRFLARGFPTTRDEDWRFTNVAPIAALPFERAVDARVDASTVDRLDFGGAIGPTIVVVNGRVSARGLPSLPPGVTVRTLADAPGDAVVPRRPGGGHAFVDLNTAFFEDVIAIEIAPRTVVREPLHVLFVTAPGPRPSLVTPRLFVAAAEQAECTIVESYADAGDGQALVAAVTDVFVAPGAHLDHVKLQRQRASSFHVGTMFVHLGRAATFTSHSLTLGGRIARNDVVSVLDGEGAESTLNGLYVASGESLVDNHTTIDHAQPHCPSHEVYKGILAGRSRAVFNGKILVRPDAQKTDAKQTNKALLLTDEAQINTKPQLEIFADDVKCTHGAAIGQLDEDAMFYLRARGIAAADARNLLIHAFAGDVLGGVRVEAVRDEAMHMVEALLGLPA